MDLLRDTIIGNHTYRIISQVDCEQNHAIITSIWVLFFF